MAVQRYKEMKVGIISGDAQHRLRCIDNLMMPSISPIHKERSF